MEKLSDSVKITQAEHDGEQVLEEFQLRQKSKDNALLPLFGSTGV
jgi:hypothetical protein